MDKDYIMIFFAASECRRALDNLDQVDRLADVRHGYGPGAFGYPGERIFDHIRLALQMAANVSRLFWPQRKNARSAHLRSLTGLPEKHYLSDRSLRNHIEHSDERLDAWTSQAPRPFASIEVLIPNHDVFPENFRDEMVAMSPIVYDAKNRSVYIFGDIFSLTDLRDALEDAMKCIIYGGKVLTSRPPWTTD